MTGAPVMAPWLLLLAATVPVAAAPPLFAAPMAASPVAAASMEATPVAFPYRRCCFYRGYSRDFSCRGCCFYGGYSRGIPYHGCCTLSNGNNVTDNFFLPQ